MKLKPARPGLVIRDPITREPLAAGGEEKSLTPFWRKRINDGDVVEVPAAKPARPKPAASGGEA